MKRLCLVSLLYVVALVAFGQTNVPPAPDSISDATGKLVDQIVNFLNALNGLPSHIIVGLTCIVMGYVLRIFKKFPNDGIPLVCVLWGMVFNPLMAEVRAPGSSLRLWIVKNILMGLLIGAFSWLLHKYFLSRFEDKIPVLGNMLASADKKADAYQANRLASKGVVVNVFTSTGSNATV